MAEYDQYDPEGPGYLGAWKSMGKNSNPARTPPMSDNNPATVPPRSATPEPRTEAGRRLLGLAGPDYQWPELLAADILAIEAEAATLPSEQAGIDYDVADEIDVANRPADTSRSATPEPRRRYRNGPKVQALLDAHGNGTWGSVRLGQVFDAIEEVEAEARSVPPSEPPALDVTPVQLANAMAAEGYADPDWQEQWVAPVESARRILDRLAALRPPAEYARLTTQPGENK